MYNKPGIFKLSILIRTDPSYPMLGGTYGLGRADARQGGQDHGLGGLGLGWAVWEKTGPSSHF